MDAPVIRISLGKFDAVIAPQVEAKLRELRARVEPGVRAMKGNRAYWCGIDRTHDAMHNVSIWDSVADAQQMDSLEPMLQAGREFAAMGVRFERPILNFDTLWSLAAVEKPG